MVRVCVIPGDGVGPEVMGYCLEILQVMDLGFEFVHTDAGLQCHKEHGVYLHPEALTIIKDSAACLFGAVTRPPPERNYISPLRTLRRELELYANVRPIRTRRKGMSPRPLDLVLIRENSEGLYTQRERAEDEDTIITERVITRLGCERIIKFAFDYAISNDRKRVSCVHKANVLRKSDGMFREIFYFQAYNFASRRYGLEVDDYLVDAAALNLVRSPEKFDVMVTLNLYGDILGGEAGGLIGGPGVSPAANIGDRYAVFEPTHGSSPGLAGKDVMNPSAMILSACMMLKYLGKIKEADLLSETLDQLFERNVCTIDIGGSYGTKDFTHEFLQELERLTSSTTNAFK